MDEAERAEWRAALLAVGRRRDARHREEVEHRREQAMALAREAARRLRDEFGATRVVLFGSLARGHFTAWSDADIAAFGVPAELRWDAATKVMIPHENPGDLGLDVIMYEDARPAFREAIDREGVELDVA